MSWTAICLPNGDYDKDGFETEQDAIDYVVENCICDSCKEEGWGSACAAEWLVVETDKLGDCESLGDIFDAAGMERIQ